MKEVEITVNGKRTVVSCEVFNNSVTKIYLTEKNTVVISRVGSKRTLRINNNFQSERPINIPPHMQDGSQEFVQKIVDNILAGNQ